MSACISEVLFQTWKNSTYSYCKDIPWQATSPCLSLNFKDKLLAALQDPDHINENESKKLTKEAIYMSYVIFTFIGLAVLGSTATAYEYFFKDKKSGCNKNGYEKKRATDVLNGKNSSESFLEDFKSFLKCFCVVQNVRKILSTTTPEGRISFFPGLRFLCNISVIRFHTMYVYIGIVRHVDDLKPLFDWKVSQLHLNGGYAVDVFFMISGFLNAKSFFQKYSNGNLSWFHFYFNRFLRLTPVYMIVLGFYATLFSYTGTGNLWPTFDTNPVCKKDWWYYLLYIHNFENSAQECLPLWWYMATDMQFFVISPLFMVSLMRWPLLGFALIFLCISGSCIISFLLTTQCNLIDGLSRFEFHIDDLKNYTIKFWEYFDMMHVKPYTRIIPYLVSILLAYYLHQKNINKEPTKNSKMTLCCGWIATSILMWHVFFFLHKKEEILLETAFYNGTKYLLVSYGLAWIMYTCLTGQSEFLTKILSWKYFLPLSRLSYCSYLIHPIVLRRIVFQSQDFMDFSYISVIRLYLYIVGVTYCLSFFVSLLFEIPVLNLMAWFGKKKVKTK